MKSYRIIILTVVLIVVSLNSVVAQDLTERLTKLAAVNATNYVAPIIRGWGADLNSGFYHSADLHDILGFDIQVKITAARLGEEERTFEFEMPDEIPQGPFTLRANQDYPKFVTANTAVGKKDETVIRTYPTALIPNQELFRVPGGFDVPVSPLVVPQVALGLPFGLEVIGRFIPTTKISGEGTDIGEVNYLGVGLRHDIDQYIPMLPIDLAAHFMTQKFNFKGAGGENFISASALAYGLSASKRFFIFTLYGGFQVEQATFTIGPYDATIQYGTRTESFRVPAFDIEGKNSVRALVGLRLVLLIVNIHADYSFANTPVLTLGAGITLR
jgi:hypothetical protein